MFSGGLRKHSLIVSTLFILIAVGVLAVYILIQVLRPPMERYFWERNREELLAVSFLAMDICGEGLDTLLDLRLVEEPTMVETVRRDTIQRILELKHQFSHIHIVILTDEGEMVGTTFKTPIDISSLKGLPHKPPEDMVTSSMDGGAYIFWRYYPFWRWRIVIIIMRDEANAPVVMAKKMVIYGMTGIVSILSITISAIILLFIRRPLLHIIQGAEQVSRGKIVKVPVIYQTEISKVTEAFNRMVDGLQEKKNTIDETVADLNRSLREKDVLLRELHHRVRNNLAIIVGLLNLGSSSLNASGDVVQTFNDSKSRIRAIALIYDIIHEADRLDSIQIRYYIIKLVGELQMSLDLQNAVSIDYDLDSVDLDMDEAVPLGLIVNEIIVQTLRCADNGSKQMIRISFKRGADGRYTLVIGTDILRFAERVHPESFSVVLVTQLTNQLNGSIDLTGDSGNEVTVRF